MEKKNKEDRLLGLYILLGVVFVCWVVSMFVIKWIFNDWNHRGMFGDSFGAINSLFSGLALGGIIYTIFLQKKELALQREELRETRNEFKVQNVTLRLQRFENTFFSLLTLHHQIVDSIGLDIQKEKLSEKHSNHPVETAHYDRVILRGRDVFKNLYDELSEPLQMGLEFNQDSLDQINATYLLQYQTVQTDFGHYFRNLYRIIKLIDETEFNSHEELETDPNATTIREINKYTIPNHNSRYKYTSMIRAQLSDYELLLLFYNCLSSNGNEKFKPLIEKYSLLKNMPDDKLHRPGLVSEYKESAFKKI